MIDYFFDHLLFLKFELKSSWRDAVALAAAFRHVPPPKIVPDDKLRAWFNDDRVPV